MNNVQGEKEGRSTPISPENLNKRQQNECLTEMPKINASNISNVTPTEEDEKMKNSTNLTEFPSEDIITTPGSENKNEASFEDEVKIHLSASEEKLFDTDLDQFIEQYLPTETRTVNLNNEWIITDTIGNPDFPQLLQEDPNFDLLTFITDKLPV